MPLRAGEPTMQVMECCGQARRGDFHCARCHQSFSGLGLFDAHQIRDYSGVRPPVICRDPAPMLVGGRSLAQDGRGIWCTPAGLAARERARAALARARSAKAGP